MLSTKVKDRIALRLQNSRLRQLIGEEILTLLAEKPPEMSSEDYCSTVAQLIVDDLKERLCDPLSRSNPPRTSERSTADPVPPPDLGGVIQRLTTGVEHALLSGNLQMLRALGEAIAQRDTGNSKHNPRVTLVSTLLAEAMELESKQIQALMKGSFLHDIGKIGIRDEIILKPAGLTESERMVMNSHTELGESMIRGVRWLDDAREVIRSHHERYDGTGYPDGLRGKSIPLNARIFAVVDVFDALTSDRPYKDAYSFDEAMQYLFDQRKTHFDPWIVESFANISRQVFDELTWETYHVLDRKLRAKVVYHFGLVVPPPSP